MDKSGGRGRGDQQQKKTPQHLRAIIKNLKLMKIPHAFKMGEVSAWLAKGKLMPADLEETVPSCY